MRTKLTHDSRTHHENNNKDQTRRIYENSYSICTIKFEIRSDHEVAVKIMLNYAATLYTICKHAPLPTRFSLTVATTVDQIT